MAADSKHMTPLERRFPRPQAEEFLDLISWGTDAWAEILNYVWCGCDTLLADILAPIGGVTCSDKSIERATTQALVIKIQDVMPSVCPFRVQHEVYEFESQETDQAQPPQYDIGFISVQNPRRILPVEAKVLRTDARVNEYLNEIKDNYLACRYAPFSSEGGMLGYLLVGDADKAFVNIERRLKCPLMPHPGFQNRRHRTSEHKRGVPEGKDYPVNFRCHHLILELGA